MIGYELNLDGNLGLVKNTNLDTTFISPILVSMYEQREQRRLLFQRNVLARTIPDAVHDLPRISFLERQQGE